MHFIRNLLDLEIQLYLGVSVHFYFMFIIYLSFVCTLCAAPLSILSFLLFTIDSFFCVIVAGVRLRSFIFPCELQIVYICAH